MQSQKLGSNEGELKNLSSKLDLKDAKIKELEENVTKTSQMLIAKQNELENSKKER